MGSLSFWGWMLGSVLTATFVGNLACDRFSTLARKKYNAPKPTFRETGASFPAWITGLVERIFFAALVAVDAAGYAPAMVAWLALKLVASWTWQEFEKDGPSFEVRHATHHSMRKSRIVSMLTGAISMGMALAAGLMFKQALDSIAAPT